MASPHFSPGGEMIAQGFGLMKYIFYITPSGSLSDPDPFQTDLSQGVFRRSGILTVFPTEENALWIQITSEGSFIR
jgi:hypothetical protein